MQRNHIFVHKKRVFVQGNTESVENQRQTDGNFVQLHKHAQGREQCICLKKALQTSQGAPACAPCIIPFSSSLPFSSFSPFRALSVYTKKEPRLLDALTVPSLRSGIQGMRIMSFYICRTKRR